LNKTAAEKQEVQIREKELKFMHDHEVEREKEKLFLRNAEIVAQEEREEKLKKKIET